MSLDVSITPGSGMFEVCESGTLVVSGRVFQPSEPIIDLPLCDPVEAPQDAHLIRLTSSDVYKQLRLRGYDYGPTFQGILSASNKGEAVVFREGGGGVSEGNFQWNIVKYMEYVVHGSRNQNDSNFNSLIRFAETNERHFDLLLQICRSRLKRCLFVSANSLQSKFKVIIIVKYLYKFLNIKISLKLVGNTRLYLKTHPSVIWAGILIFGRVFICRDGSSRPPKIGWVKPFQ